MPDTAFIKIIVKAKPDKQDQMVALLHDFPVNGFEHTDKALVIYVPVEEWYMPAEDFFVHCCEVLDVTYKVEELPAENWNATWESAFRPIKVGRFAGVRASFHPPFKNVEHELLIDPRMAFGTGHHATTYMMMEHMATLAWQDTQVFDYGCGTGILAILARRLGASSIDAVDIDPLSTENTTLNISANKVDGIDVYTGTLEAVPTRRYGQCR